MELNTFERIIYIFSPRAALQRARDRVAFNYLQRSFKPYEAAGTGRRFRNWNPGKEDSEKTVALSLNMLRNRSRDLVRNNPYATRGIGSIVSNTIGTGIIAKSPNENIDKVWKSWAETSVCDHSGHSNFYGLQSLVLRSIVENGDVIIRRVWSKDKKLSIPLQLQVLEGDFIDESRSETTGNGDTRYGIKYDKSGKVAGYWLFESHPGSNYPTIRGKYQSVFVPAEDIIHVFRKERAGQVRGTPWLAPVILKLRDLDEYEDAQLVRQKIAACFTGFLTTNEGPNIQSSTEEQKPMSEKFQPGQWEVLPPGFDIKFASPPGVGNDYDMYLRRTLTSIAAGLGITYEALTSDLSNVNFSSGRMGWLEYQRSIEDWRWRMLIPGFCEKVWLWFMEAAIIKGAVKPSDWPSLPEWTPPRREMIDPSKEIDAMKNAIRSGLATLSDSVRQLGYDPKTHFLEMSEDNKLIDSLGLVLDTDPRKMSQGGQAQTQNNDLNNNA